MAPELPFRQRLLSGSGAWDSSSFPRLSHPGPGHHDRVDAAAAANGLERLLPRRGATIALTKGNADVGVFRDIFVGPWFGTNRDLLPERLRALND